MMNKLLNTYHRHEYSPNFQHIMDKVINALHHDSCHKTDRKLILPFMEAITRKTNSLLVPQRALMKSSILA